MSRSPPLHRALLILADPRLPANSHVDCDWRGERWTEFFRLADAHGVLGIVLRNLARRHVSGASSHDGPLPEFALAHRCWRAQLARTLRLRQCCRQLVAGLDAAGIRVAVLKGADFADHLYPDPSLRPTRDIDLLVSRDDWLDSQRELRRLGFDSLVPLSCKHPIDHYGQRAWTRPADDGISVELHWNLINSPVARGNLSLTLGDLSWEPSATHGSALSPTPATRLLLASLHGTISHQFERLLHLCDVREACRQMAAQPDLQSLEGLLERTGAQVIVRLALAVTGRILADADVVELSRRLPIRGTQRIAAGLISVPTLLSPDGAMPVLRRKLLREWLKRAA